MLETQAKLGARGNIRDLDDIEAQLEGINPYPSDTPYFPVEE